MKNSKSSLIKFSIVFALFIIFTILIKTIDIQEIGPLGTEVGFASINDAFRNIFSYSDLFYKISKYLGYLSFGIIVVYALTGLIQLIKRKNLLKVDNELLTLGGFYVVVLFVYFLFEKVIVNFRPVLEDGKLEASYPSSHTVLAICVCVSSIMISKKIFKNKKYNNWFNIGTCLLMFGIVLTRVLSGVHWLTDIIGGILISIALCLLFDYVIKMLPKKNKIS